MNDPFEDAVELFSNSYPRNLWSQQRKLGIECEFPIVEKSTGQAPPFAIIEGMFHFLESRGYTTIVDSGTKQVVRAEKAHEDLDSRPRKPGINVIELELGYCTIEVSVGPESMLAALHARLGPALRDLADYLAGKNCALLGYGMQPLTHPSKKFLAPRSRYKLYDKYVTNRYVGVNAGSDVHLFTVAAACQVHLDVSADEAIIALNAFNRVCGPLMALAANSCVWAGVPDNKHRIPRELFYDCVYGNNPKFPVTTFGVAPHFLSFLDYCKYIGRTTALMAKRGDSYIDISHDLTVSDFLHAANPLNGKSLDGVAVIIEPEPKDLLFFATFLEFCARLSPIYGTLECRMFCEQPWPELFCIPALVLGLVENLSTFEAFASKISAFNARDLRIAAATRALNGTANGFKLTELCSGLLSIAEDGLTQRQLGEEMWLEPLFRRVRSGSTPGDTAIGIFQSQGFAGLIELTEVKY
jgi:gamma-glutamylcysteine synthetase